ncbi:MAG TPA: ferrous iron transport protein A [bacterium]|nr:ferrous iron transport protein A [bacterium]
MPETLDAVEPGAIVRVLRIAGGCLLRTRFVEMGLLPGALVRVVRIAPLGDPMEVRVRGSSLSLRRSEAAMIQVERPKADRDPPPGFRNRLRSK